MSARTWFPSPLNVAPLTGARSGLGCATRPRPPLDRPTPARGSSAGAPRREGHRGAREPRPARPAQPPARAQDAGAAHRPTPFVRLRVTGADSGRRGPRAAARPLPGGPGRTLGQVPSGRAARPRLGKATGSPGSCGVPTGAGPGAGPGSGAGGGVPGGRRAGGGPGPGEGRLTEIDVSEGAAADLPAQPVPVPDSELHGGGGGPGSLLPSRPLPGSELGEAAPLLPLLRVRLPTPPPSRPRFHHRFPAAPPLPAPQ